MPINEMVNGGHCQYADFCVAKTDKHKMMRMTN